MMLTRVRTSAMRCELSRFGLGVIERELRAKRHLRDNGNSEQGPLRQIKQFSAWLPHNRDKSLLHGAKHEVVRDQNVRSFGGAIDVDRHRDGLRLFQRRCWDIAPKWPPGRSLKCLGHSASQFLHVMIGEVGHRPAGRFRSAFVTDLAAYPACVARSIAERRNSEIAATRSGKRFLHRLHTVPQDHSARPRSAPGHQFRNGLLSVQFGGY
jgi:hypothetical protein